jgi:enoyl-CoA hydratase
MNVMTYPDVDYLELNRDIDGVLVMRLNRPDKRNAINTALLTAIADALNAGDEDEAIRAFVITGAPRVFAAGADLNEMSKKRANEGLEDPRPALWARVRMTRKPLIAAVEGWCLGAGNELALCADMLVASKSAKFGQPETNLGIIPGAGGCAILTRLIGRARTMQMVLTGEPITADEALQYGLINLLVEEGEAHGAAVELASKLAGRAPLAMRQAKAVINQAWETGVSANLAIERQAFSLLLSSEDKQIGVDAFINKEKPAWKGK